MNTGPRHWTWRRLRLSYGSEFLEWVQQSGAKRHALQNVGGSLLLFFQRWFLDGEHGDRSVERARFFEQLVPTAQCCDQVLYDDVPTAAAYAFQHLLERYRRTWQVLEELMHHGALPFGRYGVNLLDVGTGPAPTIYAIRDFYGVLNDFADERNVPIPPLFIEPAVVEPAHGMVLFMHNLSEVMMAVRPNQKSGPFGARFSYLRDVDIGALREDAIERTIAELLREDDDLSPAYARKLANESGELVRQFSYRFIVFSNVLTTMGFTQECLPTIIALLENQTAGAIAYFTGGVGRGGDDNKDYQEIFHLVDAAAATAAWTLLDLPAVLMSRYDDEEAAEVARYQRQIWSLFREHSRHEAAGVEPKLPHLSHVFQDDYTGKGAGPFSVRVYRKGRLPQ